MAVNGAATRPQIEPATSAAAPEIFDLFQRYQYIDPDLDKTAFVECWRHQFFGGAQGAGCVYLARDGEGQVVAHYGVLPFPYIVRGERKCGGFICQLFVHPAYRQTSLFFAMERRLLREYAGFGIDFLYGLITIKPVLRAHLGLGFAKGPDLHIYAFPLAPGKGLSAIWPATPRLAAAGLDVLGNLASRTSLALTRLRRRSMEVEEIATLDRLDEEILARANANWAIHAEHSRETFRSRFRPFGRKQYRIFAALDGGRDQGYIVLRRTKVQQFQVVAIIDLIAPQDARAAAASLLLRACREGIETGCDAVVCLARPGTAEARALRSSLFWRTPASFTLIADRQSELVATGGASWAGSWHSNWFDHDYI